MCVCHLCVPSVCAKSERVCAKSECGKKVNKKGVRNCCFVLDKHSLLLSEADVLPYVLLPLCGPEEFDTEDMENMPMEIQLLPPTKVPFFPPK